MFQTSGDAVINTGDNDNSRLVEKHNDFTEQFEGQSIGLVGFQEIMMTKEIISLLGVFKKYLTLIHLKKDLPSLHSNKAILKEMYNIKESDTIIDIRTQFEMFYAYTNEPYIIKNIEKFANKFEDAVAYLNENFVQNPPKTENEYIQILDSYADIITDIITLISTTSIFEENN